MLATVGVPPEIATAPPLTRMVPAALRLTVMVLSRQSPKTVRVPAEAEGGGDGKVGAVFQRLDVVSAHVCSPVVWHPMQGVWGSHRSHGAATGTDTSPDVDSQPCDGPL